MIATLTISAALAKAMAVSRGRERDWRASSVQASFRFAVRASALSRRWR
jgi:hypothetical protein